MIEQVAIWTVTLIVFYSVWVSIYRRTNGFILFHPIFALSGTITLLMVVLGLDYEHFSVVNAPFSYALNLAIVSLAIPIYKSLETFKRYAKSLGWKLPVLSLVLILLAIGPMPLLLSETLWKSLIPKSVTTPVAYALAELLDAVPSVSVIAVSLTGIIGGFIGPYVLDKLRIEAPMVRGLSIGLTAHAFGTTKLLENNPVEAGFSALGMGLNAIITALWVPLLAVAFVL